MVSEYGELFTHEGGGLVTGNETGRVMAKFSHEAEADSFCELVRDNEQLQAKNDALVARVARLEQALKKIANFTQDENLLWWQKEARAALNETESESLAYIQAAAIELALKTIEWGSDNHWNPIEYLTKYAKLLRKQGGE